MFHVKHKKALHDVSRETIFCTSFASRETIGCCDLMFHVKPCCVDFTVSRETLVNDRDGNFAPAVTFLGYANNSIASFLQPPGTALTFV
jgi:hypothetical protein